MNIVDIILGVLLLIGLVRGFQRGFILELTGIIGLIAGIFGALEYSYIAESYFTRWTDLSTSNIEIIGFFISFLIITLAVSILGKILTKIVHTIALGMVNRLLGALFGVVKTGLFIFILILIFEYINTDERFLAVTKLQDSFIVSTIKEVSSALIPSLEELIETSNLLDTTDEA
ncbi:CvpA family protein [Psychroflexus torquis]|nr:CvpA family protein [Psychroflexus torquis]